MAMMDLLAYPVVTAVVLSTLALLGVLLVASGMSAWYEERMRRIDAVVRKGAGLASGFGAFHGVAQNLDTRSGGELVRREQTQVSLPGRTSAGWRDRACTTTARPFVLVLDSGAEIEIDAGEPRLVGFPETTSGAYTSAPFEAPRREMIARVSAGDAIWAIGVLTRPTGAGGAYRSSVSRRKLRAPRRGEIELSVQSPLERWKGRAVAHKRGMVAALGGLVLLHGLFYRNVDALILDASRGLDFYVARSLGHDTHWPHLGAVIVTIAVVASWFYGVRRAGGAPRRG